ncbi:hypothetical protein PLICRDRAFT_48319 [Plicaturopsis crispa FD-325 SS-3]|nr:hypothetical protein PLICRDRAFT_48319 [Plicaturopsis crispa FD-325 SS-3]
MADLYPPPAYPGRQQQSYHRPHEPTQQQSYGQMSANGVVYPSQVLGSAQSGSSSNSSEDNQDPAKDQQQQQQQPQQSPPAKAESKPQATFLTKLYALLERPENHHMIRWDPAGEHIIVERPEQLALHVLPSIYRQSRFASFSRQLNIYGFMRKVNLRNVDPAIDDPDASTWSHPTLNRHSPPEVVANFKRRVPPRLPKPRKRDMQEQQPMQQPRSAIGMGQLPLSVPKGGNGPGRSRGFSAPGTFTPLSQGGAAGWNTSYPRSVIPPLTVPSEPPHMSHSNMYSHSSHNLHPITPTDDSPTSAHFNSMSYSQQGRGEMMVPSSQYPYSEQQSTWQFSPNSSNSNSASHSGGSLSSLLNPSSNGYPSRPQPTINTSYASPFSSMPMHPEHHSASSLSPDSRPTTGYSMSSVSSLPPYEDGNSAHMHGYDSRPGSSHHRAPSPSSRPTSKSGYPPGSLSVRRARRHSQAVSPYPSPYEHPSSGDGQHRPSTSPQPAEDHQGAIPRVRSMIQLPSVDPYSFNSGHADFAYSAAPGAGSIESLDGAAAGGWNGGGRPSTTSSSISAASHTSSQVNTPPVDSYGAGETDINRCE